MSNAIKVEDLLSMQVFFYRNLRRAVEDPSSPITQTYRNAQRLKAEHGYPFLIDGCRVSEVELTLCAPFGSDFIPVSNYEGDFEPPYTERTSDEVECGECGHAMTLVRPGKHQCDNPDCEE